MFPLILATVLVSLPLVPPQVNSPFTLYEYMRANFTYQDEAEGVDYWQTPEETAKLKKGDCEDWAILILSMFREYNPSLNCYGALWETHMSVLCYSDSSFLIYDQAKTKFKTTLETENMDQEIVIQENKVAIRSMLNSYFSDYGISPNQRKLYSLFNEKELFIFNSTEDFVNWAIKLIQEENS